MSRAGTKSVQRKIDQSDLEFPGWLNAPIDARSTAVGLWVKATDAIGRAICNPTLLAGLLYPGQAATEIVTEHLLLLEECRFLQLYRWHEADLELLALTRPLKADLRGFTSAFPDPPPLHGIPRSPVAVGGALESERVRAGGSAREQAEEQVRAEQAERASMWAEWESEQERTEREPKRPLLLDAPPIGCPDHPNGAFEDCGPCGTARRRHDRWVSQERHIRDIANHHRDTA